jgi:hypothetical protein
MIKIKFSIYILALSLFSNYTFGQTRFETVKSINFTVNGTSTLHDWEMKGSGGKCSAIFDFDGPGKISGLKDISFSFPAKLLKSGKDAMDGNAYKSLKTDKHPNITGSFANAKAATTDNINYKITANIKLQIAGFTKDVPVSADGKLNKDGSFTIKGEKKIDMKEFKVDPPSFMFGSVKTGKDIVVKFDLTLTK